MQILTTSEFDKWLADLRDKAAAAHIHVRITRLAAGNFGDCAALGGGISEMRVHHGPGYRVYFTKQGTAIVILLAGGDKSTQPADIRRARQILRGIRGLA